MSKDYIKKINIMITPNRGYQTVWQMSMKIPHKKMIELFGVEPSIETEGILFYRDFENHKYKNDNFKSLGHWYVDINGTPMRVDLSKNSEGIECIVVWGAGSEDWTDLLEAIACKFGMITYTKWKK